MFEECLLHFQRTGHRNYSMKRMEVLHSVWVEGFEKCGRKADLTTALI